MKQLTRNGIIGRGRNSCNGNGRSVTLETQNRNRNGIESELSGNGNRSFSVEDGMEMGKIAIFYVQYWTGLNAIIRK